jgi:hypothetical protein
MTRIRVNHTLFGDDLYDASNLSTSAPRYLPESVLAKKRPGPRPTIYGRTMPQRQYRYPDSEREAGVWNKVSNMMKELYEEHKDILVLAPSKTEGGSTDAIYALKTLPTLNPIVLEPQNKLLDGEIAHAHPSEGSLHVWMSQSDARVVVEGGWGMRFPLTFVDKGWVMVYAPRTMEEVEVVKEIVKAAIAFLTAVRV